MKVQFYTKNVYGNTLIYLVDGVAAKAILNLIGQKTISKKQMSEFELLNIKFEQVINPDERI